MNKRVYLKRIWFFYKGIQLKKIEKPHLQKERVWKINPNAKYCVTMPQSLLLALNVLHFLM